MPRHLDRARIGNIARSPANLDLLRREQIIGVIRRLGRSL